MEVNGHQQTPAVLSPARKAGTSGRGGCVGPRAILNVYVDSLLADSQHN